MHTVHRALLAIAGAALLVLPPVAPALAGDAIDEEVASFKDYLASKPAADGLKNKIADLASKKDPRIADVLAPLLATSKYPEEVKEQVCLAIGKQGATKHLATLMAVVDGKDNDEKFPKLVAAAIEGIGELAPTTKYDWLVKTGNKYLDTNGEISGAAWKGVGNVNTAAAIDDLVQACNRCDATGTAKEMNAVKKASRAAAKVDILNSLQKITGKDIKDSSVWDKWWRENKKTWKPTPAGKEKADINASDTYKDDAYGFSIKRPSKVWLFRKGDGHNEYMRLEANDEGSPAAWIDVFVQSVKGKVMKTPEQFAEADKGQFEPKFRNLKEQVWDKKCSYGGVKGLEVELLGQHKDWDAVFCHNVYLEKNEVMYRFFCVWKSGKSQSLRDDIENLLKTGLKFDD